MIVSCLDRVRSKDNIWRKKARKATKIFFHDYILLDRQLGFRGGVAPGAGFFGGKRYGPIYSTHNGCYGSEARLLDCGQKEEVGDQCLHEEDAAVICNLGEILRFSIADETYILN